MNIIVNINLVENKLYKLMRIYLVLEEILMKKTTLQIIDLLDLKETIASKIFDGLTYPWEALPKISKYIIELGRTLSEKDYIKVEKIYGYQKQQ